MRCHDVGRFMSLFLDSELSPEINLEIVEHLEQCPSCAARIEGERQLEERMRELLLRSTREDEAAWERAVGLATRRARGRVLRWRTMSGLALAAALGAILLGVFWPPSHREMDLARSTYTDHSRFLEEAQEEQFSGASLDDLRHVVGTLSSALPTPASTPSGYRLLKVGRCTLEGAPVAYLILATKDEPISLFIMDRALLQRFPDASARLAKEPVGVTCQVNGRSFFLTSTASAAACGIGRTEPGALRDLVHWLLPS